jgi:glycosyltransferase involved in cell wall biosynthesis
MVFVPLHIAIPTHAAPLERLSAAVRSALQCPGVSRIWVIDDGSPVPVTRVISEAASTHSPVGSRAGGAGYVNPFTDDRVVIVTQSNAGPSAARNSALDRAIGASAVLFLDDDDVLLPAGVAAMVALADRTKAAAAVASREHHRPDGVVARPAPPQWAGGVLPSAGCVFTPISLFGTSGCLVREPVLKAGIRFDPNLWHGEDRDFLRRCGDVGPIAVSQPVALRVTIHGTKGNNLSSVARLERRIRDHLVLLARHYARSEDANWLEATNWLLNAVSKRPKGIPPPPNLPELLKVYEDHGWNMPLRQRLRLLVRDDLRNTSKNTAIKNKVMP